LDGENLMVTTPRAERSSERTIFGMKGALASFSSTCDVSRDSNALNCTSPLSNPSARMSFTWEKATTLGRSGSELLGSFSDVARTMPPVSMFHTRSAASVATVTRKG
jgi:hypothetical protein